MAEEKETMTCPQCAGMMRKEGDVMKCETCGHMMNMPDAQSGGVSKEM